MSETLKLVQMRLFPSVISRVKTLQEKLQCESPTHTVVKCVSIAMEIVTAIEQGEEVLISSRNGTDRLVIPGLNG